MNMLLKNEWIHQEIKEEIKKTWKQMKIKQVSPNTLECSNGTPKRKLHCNSDLSQEARKVLYTQPNLTTKGARKGAANKGQSQQKKGNIKDESINKL